MSEDWNQYQKLVLSELKRLGDTLENLRKDQTRIDKELGLVKFKSSGFGLIGGIISGIATMFTGGKLH